MITLDYRNSKPLHEQIKKNLQELIISGSLKCDEQLPSVRELSVSLTVNPNTVQRAYKELEADGFIYSLPGKGSFVAQKGTNNSARTETLYKKIEAAVKELSYLGENKEGIINIVNNIYQSNKD